VGVVDLFESYPGSSRFRDEDDLDIIDSLTGTSLN
jgi:hypothetical protein